MPPSLLARPFWWKMTLVEHGWMATHQQLFENIYVLVQENDCSARGGGGRVEWLCLGHGSVNFEIPIFPDPRAAPCKLMNERTGHPFPIRAAKAHERGVKGCKCGSERAVCVDDQGSGGGARGAAGNGALSVCHFFAMIWTQQIAHPWLLNFAGVIAAREKERCAWLCACVCLSAAERGTFFRTPRIDPGVIQNGGLAESANDWLNRWLQQATLGPANEKPWTMLECRTTILNGGPAPPGCVLLSALLRCRTQPAHTRMHLQIAFFARLLRTAATTTGTRPRQPTPDVNDPRVRSMIFTKIYRLKGFNHQTRFRVNDHRKRPFWSTPSSHFHPPSCLRKLR